MTGNYHPQTLIRVCIQLEKQQQQLVEEGLGIEGAAATIEWTLA